MQGRLHYVDGDFLLLTYVQQSLLYYPGYSELLLVWHELCTCESSYGLSPSHLTSVKDESIYAQQYKPPAFLVLVFVRKEIILQKYNSYFVCK